MTKMETGVKRLDDLLDGGLPGGSATLLYGPPFIGKDVLSRIYFLHGLSRGTPGILVLTSEAVSDARRSLTEMDPRFPEYEKAGLAQFVDTYSKSIGAEDDYPHAQYVDAPSNLNQVALAIGQAQRKLIEGHPYHRMVFDSLSTLMAYTNAATTFRFLQVMLGQSKRAGGTSLLLVDAGMHQEPDVQMVKHLAQGVIEVRAEGGHLQLHIEGVGVTENRGWVEYRFGKDSFDITGSFSAGRIK